MSVSIIQFELYVIHLLIMHFISILATEEEGDSDVSNTSATPQSGAVVGHKFFGPDFSLDAFKGKLAFLAFLTCMLPE